MNDSTKMWIGIALFAVFVFGGIYQSATSSWVDIQTDSRDIYQASLPFGILTVEGEIGGSGGLFMWNIYGELRQVEAYYVKYFVGEELHSISLDASQTPIVIDGTLKLEKITSTEYVYLFFNFVRRIISRNTAYKIHIPVLPESNLTMTTWWDTS